jgi:hypothetical protein
MYTYHTIVLLVYYLHSDGVFDGGGGNFTAYVSQDVGTFENVV